MLASFFIQPLLTADAVFPNLIPPPRHTIQILLAHYEHPRASQHRGLIVVALSTPPSSPHVVDSAALIMLFLRPFSYLLHFFLFCFSFIIGLIIYANGFSSLSGSASADY